VSEPVKIEGATLLTGDVREVLRGLQRS